MLFFNTTVSVDDNALVVKARMQRILLMHNTNSGLRLWQPRNIWKVNLNISLGWKDKGDFVSQ